MLGDTADSTCVLQWVKIQKMSGEVLRFLRIEHIFDYQGETYFFFQNVMILAPGGFGLVGS